MKKKKYYAINWDVVGITAIIIYSLMIITAGIMRIVFWCGTLPYNKVTDGIISIGWRDSVWDVFPHMAIRFSQVIGWSFVGIIGLFLIILIIKGIIEYFKALIIVVKVGEDETNL